MHPDPAPGAPHLGVRDLRADLAAHVRRAEAGERVIVTVDGRPAAQLAPISPGGTPDLDDLAAAGLVRRPLRSDRPGPPQDLPLLPIDERTLGRAIELGTLYGLRTVDAVHLAALDRLPRPLGLATLDARQIPAAVSLDMEVVTPLER